MADAGEVNHNPYATQEQMREEARGAWDRMVAARPATECTGEPWTDVDLFRAIYGVEKFEFWGWESTIVDQLRGKVSLAVVVSVVRAAHEAFDEGGSQRDD